MELSKGTTYAIIGVVALVIFGAAYFVFVGSDPTKQMSAGAQKNMQMYQSGKMPDNTANANGSRPSSPMSPMSQMQGR